MGNEYGKHLLGKPNPRVGLLSIGEEDSKGNEVTKEAFKLLKNSPLNFIGNVEGRDVYSGNADVVVCDGFIGNVALKISEGVADTIKKLLIKEISGSFFGRLAYPLIASPLLNLKRRIDYAEFGGAPLLGVNGITMICHGRSSAKAIKNAIRRAKGLVEGRVARSRRIPSAVHGRLTLDPSTSTSPKRCASGVTPRYSTRMATPMRAAHLQPRHPAGGTISMVKGSCPVGIGETEIPVCGT